MARLLWVCLGSAVGGGARYLLSGWALARFGVEFPYGTLLVNVVGSFLVAVLMYAGMETTLLPQTARIALTVGVMGGFTTYSTFSFETMKAMQEGAVGVALTNVLVTVLGCLAACWVGWIAARALLGP